MWCYYGDRNSTKQKPSSGVSHCLPSYSIGDTYQVGAQFWGNERCGSINLQISSMWRSSCLPSSLPITPLNTIIQRGGGGKKSISCNAARVQNCPNSSQAQPDTTAYSQSRLCLWTHFSLAHFDSLFGCVLWHLAQMLPPCLFCLLSRDDRAIVLVNHLHNTYEACSLSGCWNCVYIFYKLQGGRSAFHAPFVTSHALHPMSSLRRLSLGPSFAPQRASGMCL